MKNVLIIGGSGLLGSNWAIKWRDRYNILLGINKRFIEIEGTNSKEILKKGCPYNFNELKKNNCVNSVFNGITITVDMMGDNPINLRLLALRSFGESLYHSLTDACLEDGYKVP